jgi:putative transcriptional regulator
MNSDLVSDGYLSGKLLISAPSMGDPRFHKSLIYICSHSDGGAMGLIVNQLIHDFSFSKMASEIGVSQRDNCNTINLSYGGPVEPSRGFILHSADYQVKGSLVINENVVLSATIEAVEAIAQGSGPKNFIVALGYTGWGEGQLDQEIKENSWLCAASDSSLLWLTEPHLKWDMALKKLGVNPGVLVAETGNA